MNVFKAVIRERGNGFPGVGAYVPGDGYLYRVVETIGTIHTDRPGMGNYIHAMVVPADWGDCSEEEEYPASVEVESRGEEETP